MGFLGSGVAAGALDMGRMIDGEGTWSRELYTRSNVSHAAMKLSGCSTAACFVEASRFSGQIRCVGW